ncbi:MAG TPA: AAA family ATPase, partial [Leptospiraceae bacterium]|nr:AAA family ATPase [Leptospiraceae bacterium]
MINKISFKNYKLFRTLQEMELRPMTVLIGKNSSGKSAIAKLFTLIEGSLSGSFNEAFRLINGGVELGAEFKDLIHERKYGQLDFVISSDSESLETKIITFERQSPEIAEWKYHKGTAITELD